MPSTERKRQALAGTLVAALILVTLAAALALVVGSPTRASAYPDFLNSFTARYPAAVGSRIAVCLLCHRNPSGGDDLNAYGDAVDEDLRFQAVENLDSDGDGYTNLEEIGALTFPGNPADNPDTVVTTTTVPGGTTTTAAPGSGGALYTANCQGCHGYRGGNLVPTTLSRSQLTQVIGAGRGGMPGFSSTLTSAQIGSIADALLGWSQTSPTTAGGPTTTTAAPAGGAGVYAASCSACHGANGGNLVGGGLSTTQIAAVTASGRGSMPAFGGTLSSAQIDAVAAYIASLGGGATTTSAGGTTTTAAAGGGAALYAANCASCHGQAGEGGVGGAIRGSALDAAAIAALIRDGLGGMPAFGDRLGAADLAALAAFTAGLASGSTGTSLPNETTTTAAPGGVSPGAQEAVAGEPSGAAWWEITLAVVLSVGIGSGIGLLLWRSGRRVLGI